MFTSSLRGFRIGREDSSVMALTLDRTKSLCTMTIQIYLHIRKFIICMEGSAPDFYALAIDDGFLCSRIEARHLREELRTQFEPFD